MPIRWLGMPYRPKVELGRYESLDASALTSPEQLCQSNRHVLSFIPASYLELLFEPVTANSDGYWTIHRAWFTCSGCHAALEIAHDHASQD